MLSLLDCQIQGTLTSLPLQGMKHFGDLTLQDVLIENKHKKDATPLGFLRGQLPSPPNHSLFLTDPPSSLKQRMQDPKASVEQPFPTKAPQPSPSDQLAGTTLLVPVPDLLC